MVKASLFNEGKQGWRAKKFRANKTIFSPVSHEDYLVQQVQQAVFVLKEVVLLNFCEFFKIKRCTSSVASDCCNDVLAVKYGTLLN